MFEKHLEGLQAERDATFAEEEAIRAKLDAVRHKRQALDAAMRALGAGPKPKPKPKGKTWGEQKANWVPSDKILDAVLEALQRNGESSVTSVAKAAGTAPETARKALNVLRERELVRLSAARGVGGAALYMPMPNGDTP